MLAPVPFNITDEPAQTVEDGDAVAPTVGSEFTVTAKVPELVHPFAPVPVTV